MLLYKLRHPNLPLLLCLCIDNINNIYIVLESTKDCKPLSYYINKKHLIKNSLKVQILFELSKTLNYLHSMEPSVIHRNLTPDNIYITSDFKVKLSGFE